MTGSPLVVVVGGGYAGIRVAKGLDPHARVVLVEPKDAFHHNVAALRGLVDPSLLPRTFMAYDGLLTRGTRRRDRVTEASADRVLLASGDTLSPDVLVLATGSTYPFPAKSGLADKADSVAAYARLHANLAQAQRIILLGAGAVGVELAGELSAAWPATDIVIVDPASEILPGPYDPELRAELHHQLAARGVTLVLGSGLAAPPATEPGELADVMLRTLTGASIAGDLWLRCHGILPVTDCLGPQLAATRTAEGYLRVDPTLRVIGHDRVYALGDIATIDVNKVGVARRQAEVVIANIRATIEGTEPTTYTPSPPGIILPLGPTGGVGEVHGRGLLPAAAVVEIKGHDMFINQYEEFLGVPPS